MFRKNTASQFVYFALVSATTGAPVTGASVTVRRCIDGTFAAGGGTVTEDSGGFYKYAMAQADTNGNNIGLFFTATGAIPVEKTFLTTAADPTDGVRLGLTALPNAAAGANGGLPLSVDASGRVDVLKVNGTSQTAGDLAAMITVVDDYVDTEVAAIKAKTDNLPSDPADASDIATSFSSIASTLATIAGYIDTEVAAIKAKTDNLPSSPAAAGDAMALTAGAVDAILDEVVEGSTTMRQMLRGFAATLLAKANGLETTTAHYRDLADSKNRVVATVDADGNRSAVTLDLT